MKRMVDEKDRKKLSTLTEADIEKLQGLHLYMYYFMIDGLNDNKEYSVRIISSENYENGTDLINGLNGKLINGIMQDGDYKVIPFMDYTLVENELQVEVLYNLDQECSLALNTLTRFVKTVIF